MMSQPAKMLPLTKLSLIAVRLQRATSFCRSKVRVMDILDFIQTAFDNGALATFTEKELPADQVHILVDDALEAFQKASCLPS